MDRVAEKKERTSFSEEKEAKRLYSLRGSGWGAKVFRWSRARNKSLFGSFSSEKEHASSSLKRGLTVAAFCAVLVAMITVTAYSVTLYRLFCQVTGAGGTTGRAPANTSTTLGRTVTVFFDTSTAPGLPWRFAPVQRSVKIRLGEDALAFFEAQNLSRRAIVGHATFNVTPDKIGIYFKKIQCFCFNEERLAPGEKVQMPVTFFVDPRLADDPSTTDVHEITLSYTFFESRYPAGALDLARFSAAAAETREGATLFQAQCSVCHALDSNKIGPALGTVAGREAGSLPGYPYSAALKAAHRVWTPDTLDPWLANPEADIPGARMPMHVADGGQRRAIIAYLTQQKAKEKLPP